MSLFTINYEKHALRKAKEFLHNAKQKLTEEVQNKLRSDAAVIYSTNCVIYLESVVSTLQGNADGKMDSIANIVISPNK